MLLDLLELRDERAILSIVERIGSLAADELALRLRDEFGIAIIDSLPIDACRHSALPKIISFAEKRWPQIEQRIATRWQRYQRLSPGSGSAD